MTTPKLTDAEIMELLKIKKSRDNAVEKERKRVAKNNVLLRKAKDAGIEATDEEVEAEYQLILSRARS